MCALKFLHGISRKCGAPRTKRGTQQLSSIKIETTNLRHRKIFYTALYHMMVAPTLFDDVDGQYRGMDGKVHQFPAGAHNYSTFSLWDTYRAAHPDVHDLPASASRIL